MGLKNKAKAPTPKAEEQEKPTGWQKVEFGAGDFEYAITAGGRLHAKRFPTQTVKGKRGGERDVLIPSALAVGVYLPENVDADDLRVIVEYLPAR